VSVFAHVLGMPVEEVLASAGGAGASLLMARAWLALVVRRRIGRHGAGPIADPARPSRPADG
jgi:hypothetical protein